MHLMHTNPSDAELKQLIANASTIAMVGASSNPEKARTASCESCRVLGIT